MRAHAGVIYGKDARGGCVIRRIEFSRPITAEEWAATVGMFAAVRAIGALNSARRARLAHAQRQAASRKAAADRVVDTRERDALIRERARGLKHTHPDWSLARIARMVAHEFELTDDTIRKKISSRKK